MLDSHPFRTAKDLAAADPLWMRREFSVIQEKLVRELNEECCLDLAEVAAPRKNIQGFPVILGSDE